ncbi:carbohydrate ABC transporter permease [Lacticaseibacillus hegangensis]|uniref:Carbohydrate ABC transporter permease n=1 Tax=Lacticaseibacillus hegangensis TaxID=2486010 RepID=A0ABW4CVD0_9LACO|nr:carbohydrate ABC transporter permease [Lacticaseibacillus hegangensis]
MQSSQVKRISSRHSYLVKGKRMSTGSIVLNYAVMIIVALISVFPFLWILSASFKNNENMSSIALITKHMTMVNYSGLLKFIHFDKYLFNSIVITLGGILIDIIFSSMAAYPLAKMKFKGRGFISGLLLSTMILPASASLIVNYITISRLGLLNTFAGIILPGSVSAFSIILLRQAYLAVPDALYEAARIDGASELRIWWSVMLPSVMPTITTVGIMDFINKWNAFLWPTIVAQPSHYPIATALQSLNGQFTYKFGYIASSTILSIIPVVIVFMMFQKNYLQSISGAVK